MLITLSAVFLLFPLGSPYSQAPATTHKLESHLSRFEHLCDVGLRKGWTEKSIRELSRIRDFFVAQGDPAADLLVRRLREINSQQAACASQEDGPREGRTPLGQITCDFDDLNRKSYRKTILVLVLADLFDHIGSKSQDTVLQTLATSYVSLPDFTKHVNVLDFAFFRIGPAAVPYLLKGLENDAQRVRCMFSSNLDNLAEELVRAQPPGAVKPPTLGPLCKAPTEDLHKASGDWQNWWEITGKSLPFKKPPSLLDP